MTRTMQQWILDTVTNDGRNQCVEVTKAMVVAFPELTRVRGHYICPLSGDRPHWWCKMLDGTIVDPTAAQFPTVGGCYEEWDETQPEPTGKCPNCGSWCYNGRTCCTNRCHDEYAAYCTNPF